MSQKQDSILAWALIALGGLIALGAGGCVLGVISAFSLKNFGFVIMIGGVPFFFGLLLLWAGLRLRK